MRRRPEWSDRKSRRGHHGEESRLDLQAQHSPRRLVQTEARIRGRTYGRVGSAHSWRLFRRGKPRRDAVPFPLRPGRGQRWRRCGRAPHHVLVILQGRLFPVSRSQFGQIISANLQYQDFPAGMCDILYARPKWINITLKKTEFRPKLRLGQFCQPIVKKATIFEFMKKNRLRQVKCEIFYHSDTIPYYQDTLL